MSLARKILSSTALQIFGKISTAALSIIVVKIATTYLGTVAYGQYIAVYEFLAYFGIMADLGLYTIAVKEMSRDEEKIPYILGNVLSLRTILVFCTMILATITVFLLPKYQDSFIPIGVAISALGTVLIMLTGTITSVFQVHLKMQYPTIGLIAGKIVSVSYMILTIYVLFTQNIENGFYHLMLAGVFGNAVSLLLTYYYSRKLTTVRYLFDFIFWKDIFIKALPFGLALILNTIYFRINTILMLFMLPGEESLLVDGKITFSCRDKFCSGEQIGLYGVAMRMTEVVLIIPVYFMNSVLPILSKYIKENSEKLKQLIQYSFDFLASLAFPIVFGGYVLAYSIIFLVSKPQFLSDLSRGFYGADIALKLLLFAMLFAFLNNMFGIILVTINRQTTLLKINFICVLINVLLNLIVIPIYGFRGAAIASIISELFILLATYFSVKKFLKITLSFGRIFKILASASLMGVFIYYLQMPTFQLMDSKNVLFLVPFGGVIYLGSLFLLGGIDKKILALLKKQN